MLKLYDTVEKFPPSDLWCGNLCLVTGGSSGIGNAVANMIARTGTKVIISGRGNYHVSETGNTKDEGISYLVWDVADKNKTMETFASFHDSGKIPDVIILNAATRKNSDSLNDFVSVTEKDWDEVFSVNLYGNIFLCEQYAKVLNGRKGKIIFVSSIDGLMPACTPYGISKACLNSYMKKFTKRYANIVTIGVAPGPTATRMMNSNEEFQYYRPDHLDNRCAVPEDIANLICYLASPYGDCCSGEVIVNDGGKML